MHKTHYQSDLLLQTTFRARRLSPHRSRRGALLIELIVGAVLLSIFLGVSLPLISWVRTARRNTVNHKVAATELANQMERISAWTVESRTQARLDQLQVSEETSRILTDDEFTATIAPSSQFPELQQITLELSWKDHTGVDVKPARLIAWFRSASE